MVDFTGQVAVVVGGATGIGAMTARHLAEAGASVVVGDVNLDGAQGVAQAIRDAGANAEARFADLAEPEVMADFVNGVASDHGGLHALHLNGADLRPEIIGRDLDAVEVPLEVWDRTLQVNLRGYLLGIRFAVPHMLDQGGGAIVCTMSDAAFIGEPIRVAYAAAKAGIGALVRHVASRWGKEGIRANGVAPGLVMTQALERAPDRDAIVDGVSQVLKVPELGRPADLASVITFLLSRDAAYLTGQVISVNGGILFR
jgi:NAD(P)-dependent dehydrogenase (short-subunit alcohol dehydrogenase family)